MYLSNQKKVWFNRVSIALIIFACILHFSCKNIADGSYPYAQVYHIETSEDAIINAVNTLKKHHPDFLAPNYLKEGRSDSTDYWYHIYIYLPNEKLIVYCWTRPETKNITNLAFVGVNSGSGLGNWKEINKDFNNQENKKLQIRFENEILQPVKQIIAQQRGL